MQSQESKLQIQKHQTLTKEITQENQPSKIETIVCSKSKVDLITIVNAVEKIHTSCGQCVDCGMWFSTKHLKTTDKDPDQWPIIYEGYFCEDCYAKPI